MAKHRPALPHSPEDLAAVAGEFAPGECFADLREYGQGNVHDTFLVTLDAPEPRHFILQLLNRQVFRRPEQVMGNLRLCTEHMSRSLQTDSPEAGRRWQVPRVLLTREARDHFIDREGSFWRALSFIEGAQSLDAIQDLGHAGEVGYALGHFHRLLRDLPGTRLADTLPGFHVTPGYLARFEAVLAEKGAPASREVAFALKFIQARRVSVHLLEQAKARGELALRPIHGDPKVNNVLLDNVSGRAVAMVDLDTVKPGLVHYDLGDCLRSSANPLGEETEAWERVSFAPETARAVLHGYLSRAGEFLSGADYAYIYDAVRLIAFELGLRFFTDYLAGNIYFKAAHREHNLLRALVQFQLTASIESQEMELRAMIRDETPSRAR